MMAKKRLQRFSALLYKEMVQMMRDGRTLMLLFALPVVQLFLFAYAVSLTVYHLPTALVDQSHDTRSRELVRALENSGYFDILLPLQNEVQVIEAINAGTVKAGLVIPPSLAEEVEKGNGNVLILLDGSDSFSVQSGYNAANAIAQRFSISLSAQSVQAPASSEIASAMSLPIVTSTRVLYNPDNKDLTFILPGLVALIIQNVVVAHSAMAIVREREAGTTEQLLATPARPIEILIAKLIPGVIVVTFDMAIVLLFGVFWFGVPFQGSLSLFAVLSILFIISGMGLGLLISAVSKTQQQAQQLNALLMLLTMLLTGFLYPRTTMPLWTKIIGDLIPLTYYITVIRGIITKGVGITYLWRETLALGFYAILALILAATVSKKRLD
jgi:ABC-2 type transport system permease protein